MKLQSLDLNERFDTLLGVFAMIADSDTYADQGVAGRFCRETVLATATSLSTNLDSNRRAEAIKTIAWWLENRRAERRREIRTNNPMDVRTGNG
jgi:hypothetical protein